MKPEIGPRPSSEGYCNACNSSTGAVFHIQMRNLTARLCRECAGDAVWQFKQYGVRAKQKNIPQAQ